MPRYFFNLCNGVRDIDTDGTEFPGPEPARVQAVIFAGDHLRENPHLVWDGNRFVVEVRDEADRILLNVVVTAEEPASDAG